jgi:hypothetical protein
MKQPLIALALVLIGAGTGLILPSTSAVDFPLLGSSVRWTNVIDDRFNGPHVPSHWQRYHAPYANAPNNCTSPSHDYVSGGYLHLVEKYEHSRPAGVSCPYAAGWYTGGLKLDPVGRYVANDQRVTLRYRIVSRDGIVSHHVIPMRWPTRHKSRGTHRGEEDFLETDTLTGGHFLLYETRGRRIRSSLYPLDMTQWHTVRFVQLSHAIYAYVNDMTRSAWAYRGNSTTIPHVLRTTVLQQECSHSNGCPTQKTGREDIEIDWIKVDTARKVGGRPSARRQPD